MGLIILLRTGLSNGRDGEIRVRAPLPERLEALLFSAEQIPVLQRMQFWSRARRK